MDERPPEGLRLRLRSLVPAVTGISASESGEIPGLSDTVAYWTGGERPTEEWFRLVEGHWGSPGLVMRRGLEVLGYVVYAPAQYLPHAFRFPVTPESRESILLAHASGEPRTRRHLLVRTLREVRLRGEGLVEAIGSDAGLARHHLATRHLMESGWEPVERARQWGFHYTLARVELGNTVEVSEFARGLIGRVRVPSFGRSPVPGVYAGDLGRSRSAPQLPRKERPPERTPTPS